MTRALPWIAALLFLNGTAGAATTIELIDAGAAPRAPLRYQFQAGTAERVTIEMQTTMLREGSGPMPPMAASPALRTVMETRVTEVAADGSARIEMVTRSTEAAAGPASTAQPAAQMNDALADISRLGGWFRVDTRGRTIEGHAALSPASGPGTESQPMMEMALDEVNNSMQTRSPCSRKRPSARAPDGASAAHRSSWA